MYLRVIEKTVKGHQVRRRDFQVIGVNWVASTKLVLAVERESDARSMDVFDRSAQIVDFLR